MILFLFSEAPTMSEALLVADPAHRYWETSQDDRNAGHRDFEWFNVSLPVGRDEEDDFGSNYSNDRESLPFQPRYEV